MHFNSKKERRDDAGITLMQRLATNNMQTYAYFINFNEIYFLLIQNELALQMDCGNLILLIVEGM